MRRYLRTAAALCLALCLTLCLLPGPAQAEESAAEAPAREVVVPTAPEEPVEETVQEEAGEEAPAAPEAEEEPAGEPVPEVPEEILREEYAEGVFQAGAISGPRTLPEESAFFTTPQSEVIAAGLAAQRSEIDLSRYSLTVEQVGEALATALNDYPELFYVESSFQYYWNGQRVTRILPVYNSALTTQAAKAAFREAANKALAQVEPGMTDLEKALVLHDYLALNCRYDQYIGMGVGSQGPHVFSAYGALVDQNAVCQGYALAYKYLLNQLEIQAVMVTSNQVNHAWNAVQIGGLWYYVDVTWDDLVPDFAGKVLHENFLRSELGGFKTDHCTVNGVVMQKDWVPSNLNCSSTEYESGHYVFESGNWESSDNEWPLYYDKNHNFYYIAHEIGANYQVKYGPLSGGAGEVKASFHPFMKGPEGKSYYDCFGIVWLDDCLYYIGGSDSKLHCRSLIGYGEKTSAESVSFIANDTVDGKNFQDFLALRYNGTKLEAVSRADARRLPLKEFEPMILNYPVEWEDRSNGICGLTFDGAKAGIKWNAAANATLYMAGYDGSSRLVSLKTVNVMLKSGVTLVEVTRPGNVAAFRLFLVSESQQPLCAAWRQAS